MLNLGGVRIAWIIGGKEVISRGSNKITFDIPFTPKANNSVSVLASLIGTGDANVDNFTDVEVLPSISGTTLTVQAYNSGQYNVINSSVSVVLLERINY